MLFLKLVPLQYGPYLPVRIGFGLLVIGNAWLALSLWVQNIYIILPGAICFSTSAAFIFNNVSTTALSVVERKTRGIAAGLMTCCRQLGGTISMAILGTVIINVVSFSLRHFLRHAPHLATTVTPDILLGLLAKSKAAHQAVRHYPADVRAGLLRASQHAYTLALTAASLVTAVISVLGFYLTKYISSARSTD